MIEPLLGGVKLASSVCTGPTAHSFASLQINCTARCAGSGAVRGSCCQLATCLTAAAGRGETSKGLSTLAVRNISLGSPPSLPSQHNEKPVSCKSANLCLPGSVAASKEFSSLKFRPCSLPSQLLCLTTAVL